MTNSIEKAIIIFIIGFFIGAIFITWRVELAKKEFEKCVFAGSSEMYCFYDKLGH